MFSVIIPLYNKAPYIEKAIQSVLTQTFQKFELVIVDDGSTDNSFEIAEKFKSSKVQVVRQQNCGVSTARNNGVKAAKYDYIAFLDADDWWEPTFLEEMKVLIEEFPDAGIYGSNYFIQKNGKKRLPRNGLNAEFVKGIINYFTAYAKGGEMPLWTGAVVLPKDIFNEMQGFKSNLKLGEDFDLWLRIALKYKVVFLNKPLAYYNFDVEQKDRAIGKLHGPQTHILWNLDYLQDEEQKNIDLKQLLDNLRVYSLFPYYLNKKYRESAQEELLKVDWKKQPISIKCNYQLPIWYLKMKKCFTKLGSKYKTFLLQLLRK